MNARGNTRGVVYVHSSPSAVCPHIEWALSGVLGTRVELQWVAQPAADGQLRSECAWQARAGTGAKLAAALKPWPMVRFEITEEPSPGVDGERFCHAPGLGLWRARTSANGDIMITEDRLRSLAAAGHAGEQLAHKFDELLGAAWDEALEPFRYAGDGAPVTWLHRVG